MLERVEKMQRYRVADVKPEAIRLTSGMAYPTRAGASITRTFWDVADGPHYWSLSERR